MSSRQESDFVRLQQLLREADEQAEQERRHAEDEQQNRKEADERAEHKRRRAEEADKRAEQERRRTEDEQRNRQEAESRAQIEGQKTRSTTFEEYIHACYILLSKLLCIQTDKSLSIQGSITSPKNKPCPTLLKPWTDFPVLQQQLFERTYKYILQDTEFFNSTQYLTELGQDICNRLLASKKDLEVYQYLAVERPAIYIISYLQQIEEACYIFDLGKGIIFENYTNTFSNSNKEVQQSLQDLCISNKEQASSSNPKLQNTDQICIYKEADSIQSLYIVVEYKLSYKLSVFNLQAGLLYADKKSINILEDVINRITIPTDPENKFVYYSE
jgi:hypothetical protein